MQGKSALQSFTIHQLRGIVYACVIWGQVLALETRRVKLQLPSIFSCFLRYINRVINDSPAVGKPQPSQSPRWVFNEFFTLHARHFLRNLNASSEFRPVASK